VLFIQTFVGPYTTNTYLLTGTECCVVIDPSGDGEALYRAATKAGKRIAAILLTHGHFDHIDALESLAHLSGAPVYVSIHDSSMLTDSYLNASWLVGQSVTAAVNDLRTLSGDETLTFDDIVIKVIAAPGHSAGCVCYLTENALFSGDTIFADGYGRTDLPNAVPDQYEKSLSIIAPMLRRTDLYPGHGRKLIHNKE
jgi:glyoxylase-like metal-dependent hydrolase (beta-lactamase superfamily II)